MQYRLFNLRKNLLSLQKNPQGLVTAAACILSLAATVLATETTGAVCYDTKSSNAWPDPGVPNPGDYSGNCYQLCFLSEGSLTYCVAGTANKYCTIYNVRAICQTQGKREQNPDRTWGRKRVQQGYYTVDITIQYSEFPRHH